MGSAYLLPCTRCSEHVPVSLVQAGETVRCRCGQDLLVPTLRELRQLLAEPTAEVHSGYPQRAPRASSWSGRRGGLFVAGCLLLACGGFIHMRLAPRRYGIVTAPPKVPELSFDVQTLQPMQAWEAWEYFRAQRLDYRATPQYLKNRERYRELSYWLYFAWTIAGIGGVSVVGSLLPGPRHRSTR